MDLGLTRRTALVLGASSGLGLACAGALRGEGANVVMLARREQLLREESARIGATPLVGDIRDGADLRAAVELAVGTFGGLDIVVLNGGGPPPGTAEAVSAETVDQAVELLLRPVVTLVGAALPHLRASGQGRIIWIGSISVYEPIPNLALSNAIRPGVWGYLKTLSSELAKDGITVNSVAPALIATARLTDLYGGAPPRSALDTIPLGRLGTPEELGAVVAFLASRQASYVTGSVVPVDGGASKSL